MRYITQDEITKIPNWEWQLSGLVKTAWATEDGRFLFPYPPFGEAGHWGNEIFSMWQNGKMFSWAAAEDGVIKAHASLIDKGGYWELGRFVSYNDNPRFTAFNLCRMAMEKSREKGWRVLCEATQRHTSSQYICTQLGLRFAGFGMLTKIGSVYWDIIYFDNLSAPIFKGKQGIIGEPLGESLACDESTRNRLRMISGILSVERESGMPPRFFHTLPEYLPVVREIISLNANAETEEGDVA